MDIALLFHLVVKMTNLKMNLSFLSVFFLALSYPDSNSSIRSCWKEAVIKHSLALAFFEARWLLQVWLL